MQSVGIAAHQEVRREHSCGSVRSRGPSRWHWTTTQVRAQARSTRSPCGAHAHVESLLRLPRPPDSPFQAAPRARSQRRSPWTDPTVVAATGGHQGPRVVEVALTSPLPWTSPCAQSSRGRRGDWRARGTSRSFLHRLARLVGDAVGQLPRRGLCVVHQDAAPCTHRLDGRSSRPAQACFFLGQGEHTFEKTHGRTSLRSWGAGLVWTCLSRPPQGATRARRPLSSASATPTTSASTVWSCLGGSA